MILFVLFFIFFLLVILWVFYRNQDIKIYKHNYPIEDNQINPIPELDESKYSYFIVMRHGGRKTPSSLSIQNDSDPLHNIRTSLLHGLTIENEWKKIKDPDYPVLPNTPDSSIKGVKTQLNNNVWMPIKSNDTIPLTEGGFRHLKKFITTVKPFLPSSYEHLYCSATQRTVQTASVVYNYLDLHDPFKIINISQTEKRNSIFVVSSATISENYWIDTINFLLHKNSSLDLVTGLYTINFSNPSDTITNWISGITYFVCNGIPTNPQGQIITSSLSNTCDPIFIGNIADTDGNEISNNGVKPSMISSFQQYMYDTGHSLQYPIPMPKLHNQIYRIIKRWFNYDYVNQGGTIQFDISNKEYGLQGMIDWIIQQYIDNGKWVSSDPNRPTYLSPDEYRILCNFYYSNIYSSGTNLWNGHIIGSVKDSFGYKNKESIAVRLHNWATDTEVNTNRFYVCHESIIHALLSKLGVVLSLHNGNLYISPSSMCIFRKNKKTQEIDGYYLSPNTNINNNYIDVCILSSYTSSSSNLSDCIRSI